MGVARTSDKQQRIYDYIADFIADNGFGPTVREICAAVGLSSPSAVHNQLKKLEEQGLIDTGGGRKRAITLRGPGAGIPLLGTVRAGEPILAMEEVEDTLPWRPRSGSRQDYFALRVKGDSMVNAGILEGDILVVRRQQTARSGEIVVALLEDEATVKRLDLRPDGPWLLPENPAYDPIDGKNASILGRVETLVRDY